MKQYRAKQKIKKKGVQKEQKSLNTIADAITARRARKELLMSAIEKSNKTADKLTEIREAAKEFIDSGKNINTNEEDREKPKSE
jgi:hypothetical protein